MTIDHAREILVEEWWWHATGRGECGATDTMVAMLHRGVFHDTIEMGAVRRALEGTDHAPRGSVARARAILEDAFDVANRDRGGVFVISGCARSIRSGVWDEQVQPRSVEELVALLAGTGVSGLGGAKRHRYPQFRFRYPLRYPRRL